MMPPVFPAVPSAGTASQALPLADNELAAMVALLIKSRRTILPKRLMLPGPDPDQLGMILDAAASAPDHGQLLPWRFVLIPQSARARLGDVFGAALIERDAAATPEQVAQAREKAHRSPLLMLAVVDGERGDPEIDLHERIVSAGCAVQNMLLMATALGYGSALTSGKALKSPVLRALFGLSPGEHALCFISMGTVRSRKGERLRPVREDYLSILSSRTNGMAGSN
ncbi:MAG: nitroreductase [Polaromonas sp.]|nr:nitroreductase [Polaromonas sp.]